MTQIFSDGFESGNPDQWTGNDVSYDETVSVVSTSPHHGNYHSRHQTNRSGGTEHAAYYKNLTAATEAYARIYVYVAGGLPYANNDDRFYPLWMTKQSDPGNNFLAVLGIRRNSGVDRWIVIGRNGSANAGPYYLTGVDNPAAGNWYCLELYWKKHATEGIVRAYVNGVLGYEITGVDSTYYGDFDRLDVGVRNSVYGTGNSNLDVYVDCVAVSDAYVGPETGGEDLEVTGNLTVDGNAAIGNALTVSGAAGVASLNVASGFTLNGGAGTSGQVLTSNGTGNAPTWQTVSVTPSNLSGSGPIPAGWTISGPQVSGNISGNAASITGTIPWSKVTDAPSFVTSGSAVSFSGLTVSGALSVSLGLVSVTGAFSASGSMSAVVNSLDDGYGNMRVAGYIWSDEYWQHLSQLDFMNALYNHTFKDANGNPTTTGYIKFYDLNEGHPFVCLFGEKMGEDPALVCSQNLAVEKDFVAKGMLDSLEGEIALNAGDDYAPEWSWRHTDHQTLKTTGGVTSTKNPFIWLSQGGIYGSFNTLEIRVSAQNMNWDWGNLDCGNINCVGVIHGGGSNGDAFLIGDDCYLVDVGEAGIVGVQGSGSNRNIGGFKFGKGDGAYYHKLYVEGNFLKYYCNGGANPCGFMPADGWQNLGGSLTTGTPYAWRHIYGRWIHAYDQFGSNSSTIGSYDALDDLSIIKNTKSKRVNYEDVERDVIDFSNMSFLQLDEESISLNNAIGFLFGVCKSLTLAQEEIVAELESLKKTDAKQMADLGKEIRLLRYNEKE